MQLRVVHDETMRVSDPLQSFIHGFAIDVDPARRSGGQEVPESHRRDGPSSRRKGPRCRGALDTYM